MAKRPLSCRIDLKVSMWLIETSPDAQLPRRSLRRKDEGRGGSQSGSFRALDTSPESGSSRSTGDTASATASGDCRSASCTSSVESTGSSDCSDDVSSSACEKSSPVEWADEPDRVSGPSGDDIQLHMWPRRKADSHLVSTSSYRQRVVASPLSSSKQRKKKLVLDFRASRNSSSTSWRDGNHPGAGGSTCKRRCRNVNSSNSSAKRVGYPSRQCACRCRCLGRSSRAVNLDVDSEEATTNSELGGSIVRLLQRLLHGQRRPDNKTPPARVPGPGDSVDTRDTCTGSDGSDFDYTTVTTHVEERDANTLADVEQLSKQEQLPKSLILVPVCSGPHGTQLQHHRNGTQEPPPQSALPLSKTPQPELVSPQSVSQSNAQCQTLTRTQSQSRTQSTTSSTSTTVPVNGTDAAAPLIAANATAAAAASAAAAAFASASVDTSSDRPHLWQSRLDYLKRRCFSPPRSDRKPLRDKIGARGGSSWRHFQPLTSEGRDDSRPTGPTSKPKLAVRKIQRAIKRLDLSPIKHQLKHQQQQQQQQQQPHQQKLRRRKQQQQPSPPPPPPPPPPPRQSQPQPKSRLTSKKSAASAAARRLFDPLRSLRPPLDSGFGGSGGVGSGGGGGVGGRGCGDIIQPIMKSRRRDKSAAKRAATAKSVTFNGPLFM